MKRQFGICWIVTALSCAATLSAAAGVTARYTFDDAGNGGLNLLKASVGEDAIVRGGNPAADVSGIGELHATNGLGRVDGTGAIAIPRGQFLAIPHGLTKATGQTWFMRLKVFIPVNENRAQAIFSLEQQNNADAFLFMRNGTQLGGSRGWGTYGTISGKSFIGNWKTILLQCDGSGTDLYVEGVKILRTHDASVYSGGSNLSSIDYFYIAADNSGEDAPLFVDEIIVGTGSYFDQLVTIPDAGSAAFNGQVHSCALTDTADYTVTSASGTAYGFYPVTASLVDPTTKSWEDGTTADKTLWFTIRDALTPEMITHFTFDDDGNGGLNLLKAEMGTDAWVMGGSPATNITGIGGLYATNGENHTDGKGAVAIPVRQFLALPHGFARDVGQRWRMDLRCWIPNDGLNYHAYFTVHTNNNSDASLFNNGGTRIGSSDSWGGYTGAVTAREKWHTLTLMSDGKQTSAWVDGVWRINAKGDKFNDFRYCGYFGISGDNSAEDNLMFFDDIKTYVQKAIVPVEIPVDAGSCVATGETFEAPIANTSQYAVRGTRPSASEVGAYPVTIGLLDPEHMIWSDGTSGDKVVMFYISAAANSWTEEPKVGALAWTEGTASPAYTRGVSAFGTVAVYLDGHPFEGDLPTEAGTYELTFAVAGDAEHAGIAKTFTLTVLPAGETPPVLPNSAAYVTNGLFMSLDGFDNAGVGRHDGSTTNWVDVSGNGYDWAIDPAYAEWRTDGLYFKGTGIVAKPTTKENADFQYRVSTIEFTWRNEIKDHGIIFGPGFSGSSYLYTDSNGAVGFFSTSGNSSSIGVPAVTNITESYSIDYERAANAVKPTAVNKVFTNGVEVAETIHLNNYWNGGLTSYPIMGNLAPGFTNRRAKGVLKALRIYDRSLTEAERSLNAALDFLRYGTGSMPESLAIDGYLADAASQNLLVRVRVRSAGGALSVNGSEQMYDETFWMPIGTVVTVSGKFKSVKPDRIGAYIREGLPSDAILSEDGRKVTFTLSRPVNVRIGHPDIRDGFFLSIR